MSSSILIKINGITYRNKFFTQLLTFTLIYLTSKANTLYQSLTDQQTLPFAFIHLIVSFYFNFLCNFLPKCMETTKSCM